MTTSPLIQARTAHHRTTTSDWRTVTNTLVETLGTSLVALIADVAPETVGRWSRGASANPRAVKERRIREAFRIYLELVVTDSPHTVRAWFMGANPELGDDSPPRRSPRTGSKRSSPPLVPSRTNELFSPG